MRDRLVDMIQQSVNGCARHWAEIIADYLLSNGVILPTCKVGQTVWYFDKWVKRVKPIKVISYEICNNDEEEFGCFGEDFTPTRFRVGNIGKTVFLTREEAEQALKGEHHG